MDQLQPSRCSIVRSLAAALATTASATAAAQDFSAATYLGGGPNYPTDVQAIDIDQDGLLDILGASDFDDRHSAYLNLGGGAFSARILLESTGSSGAIAVGDFDADGQSEAWLDGSNSQWLFSSQAGAMTPDHQVSSSFGQTTGSQALDVDLDGDLDVVCSYGFGTSLTWWRNDSTTSGWSWTPVVLATPPVYVRASSAGDLNGDGYPDFAMPLPNADQIQVVLSSGAAQWLSPEVLPGSADRAMATFIADLDADGHEDVLFASFNDGKVGVYFGDGTGTFPNQVVLATANGAHDVRAGDLDGDGDLDVVAAGWQGGYVRVLRNDGGRQFSQWADLDGGGTHNRVRLADMDNDGDLDVLATSAHTDVFQIWHNLTGPYDCNGNGIPDAQDLASGYSTDCNGNGVPDECDVASGEALDCNGNGIPDTCDLATGAAMDCNGNGVPDDCDLAAGISSDCNANGIPDSCDIAAGLELDCNLNGIPDACDILAGTSLDCDANGIPDECDIAAGAADCNADGIPDACQIAADSTLDLNANGTLDTCEAIGTTYCSPAVSNSTGVPGEVTLLGSDLIVLNQFFVSARQLPANSFGFFIASTTPGSVNPVPNSQGTLCVIGDVGRGVGGGIFNAGPEGAHLGYANLLNMPQPNGAVAVLAGETWNFQAWYRDATGGQTTSNFTDAVAVTFQ